MSTPNTPANVLQLKERLKSVWMAGDFGQIAEYSAHEAERFIARLNLKPGTRMLDVACGTGNLSIPAAKAGASVVGVDIAPNLLETARRRAAQQGLLIQFEEGDAEELHYATGQFDVVATMYGAMFAPRPDKVVAELVRVCHPGGLIAMANWTVEGFVGKTFRLTSKYAPPPESLPAPVLWGEESVVRERFAGAGSVETIRRELIFDYPFGPAEVVQFFRKYFGPTQTTFARLDTATQQKLAAEMESLWVEHNQGDGSRTIVRAEYLEVYVHVA